MAGKSNYLENLILNWALNAAAMPSAPATTYVGLFNGDPLDTGLGGTEVTSTIRVAGRVAASFGTPVTNTGANTIENDSIVDFGVAAGDATITHFGIFDAASSGNLLYSSGLTGGTQNIEADNLVSFPVGALDVSEE